MVMELRCHNFNFLFFDNYGGDIKFARYCAGENCLKTRNERSD